MHFEDAYVSNGSGAYTHQSYYPADTSNSMDGSYTTIPQCGSDYATYCPPHPHSDYLYNYNHNLDGQSCGYYSGETYSSTGTSHSTDPAGSEMVYGDCYQHNGDTLEKYQAAFVDALEGGHSSADASGTGTTDPLLMHPPIQHQHHIPVMEEDPHQLHYEYETNYGNNEWTMNYVYPAETGCHPQQRAPEAGEAPPNYCLTTCVFAAPPEVKDASYYYDIRIDNNYPTNDAASMLHPAL